MVGVTPHQIDELRSLLVAYWKTELLLVSTVALYLYEYVLTLDQEVEYFWGRHRPWTVSRILFLVNRYVPMIVSGLIMVDFFAPTRSDEACIRITAAAFLGHFISMGLVQGMLTMRIWSLFPHSIIARTITLGSYLVCNIVLLALFFAESLPELKPIDFGPFTELRDLFTGCDIPPPTTLWHLFVPSFILHTVLYIMTAVRAILAKRRGESRWFVHRLLRDSGVFYLIVFATVGFATIGSTQATNFSVALPAIFGNLMLVMVSVSMTRVMLGIRSLTAPDASGSDWLLSDLELSRTAWKRGSHDGEIIVEVDTAEDDGNSTELERIGQGISVKRDNVTVSRVGILDDSSMPPFPFGPTRTTELVETWQERYTAQNRSNFK